MIAARKRRSTKAVNKEFTAFLTEHEPRLITIAYRYTRNRDDARDLVQEALVKALERFHQFDGRNLGGWLYTIIRNQWLDHVKRANRQEQAEKGMRWETTSPDRAELCAVLQDVLKLLGNLPRAQRRAIALVSTGSKYREVAKRNKTAVGSIKSYVSRARVTLAEAL